MQRVGRGARRTARQHARIVLDARAEADLLKHLDVVPGTLRDALRLDQLSVFLEVSDALLQLLFKILDGLLELFLRRDIVARRENCNVTELAERNAGQRIDVG